MKPMFVLLSLAFAIAPGMAAPTEAAKPNVLLIAIDDLNDWVGCLGGHPDAKTPNIDRLAKRGVLFTNAHCQAPICNPSRASIMYGLRPSNSGVYMNTPRPWTVPALKEHVTMPRHFAANGYLTLTTGKIYHGSGLPPGDFDVVGPRPGQRLKIDERLVEELSGLWDFGAQGYEEKLFQDLADDETHTALKNDLAKWLPMTNAAPAKGPPKKPKKPGRRKPGGRKPAAGSQSSQ